MLYMGYSRPRGKGASGKGQKSTVDGSNASTAAALGILPESAGSTMASHAEVRPKAEARTKELGRTNSHKGEPEAKDKAARLDRKAAAGHVEVHTHNAFAQDLEP